MDVFSRSRVMSRVLLGLMLVGASWIFLHGHAAYGQTVLAIPPAPLLPPSLQGGADHEAGNGVPSWAGADGGGLAEDGIKRYERGSVQSATARGAVPRGTVTVYQFVDATGAQSAYDYLHKSAP